MPTTLILNYNAMVLNLWAGSPRGSPDFILLFFLGGSDSQTFKFQGPPPYDILYLPGENNSGHLHAYCPVGPFWWVSVGVEFHANGSVLIAYCLGASGWTTVITLNCIIYIPSPSLTVHEVLSREKYQNILATPLGVPVGFPNPTVWEPWLQTII